MSRRLRLIGAWVVAVTATAMAGACQAQLPPKVAAVVARTKAVRTTYSLYTWIRIARAGLPAAEEWNSEFNSGALHRVETPRDRVIADCEANTGSALSLATGKITTGPQIAATACGIDTNFPVVSAEWLAQQRSSFGAADVIRITGGPFIRTYVVNADGVIIRSTYQYDAPGHPLVLQTLSTALSPSLPDKAMFTQDSLSRSFVPEAYKAGPVGQKWATDTPD